jgi:hypothetical protein
VSKLDHIQNREVELAAVNAAKKQGIKEKYQNRINAYKRVFDSPYLQGGTIASESPKGCGPVPSRNMIELPQGTIVSLESV